MSLIWTRASPSISQYSNDNKGFSIKDICPDTSFSSDSKHQRGNSQHFDYLAPSTLFAHVRKPSKPSFHDRKSSSQNPENEELNSTRMQTSQSRRISDYDLGLVPIVAHEIHEIQLESLEELKFCKYCKKSVRAKIGFPEDSKTENALLQMVSFLFSCCSLQCMEQLRVNICEECGFAI